MPTSPIAKKVCLITGASRNIGREVALTLARQGVAVAVNVRASREEGQATVDEIVKAGGEAMLCVADVTDPAAVRAMVASIGERWGRLDILINNAAIRREAKIEDITVADWRDTMAVILDAAFYCVQAALPLLRRSPEASIVNIGGMTAHTGAADRVHVVAAKAGIAGLTRALAHELSPHGITVNCIAPGMIDTTRGTSSASANPTHRSRHSALVGRRGSLSEIADSIVWMTRTEARFITGQVIHVNGGTYLGG
jgi:3-oxoacyl-[acyl-carrier protein] reductase